jgi:hypothetical protein
MTPRGQHQRKRFAALFNPIDRRVSPDEAKQRFAERDRRDAVDTRTEAQRWLNDPPYDRSALALALRKPQR